MDDKAREISFNNLPVTVSNLSTAVSFIPNGFKCSEGKGIFGGIDANDSDSDRVGVLDYMPKSRSLLSDAKNEGVDYFSQKSQGADALHNNRTSQSVSNEQNIELKTFKITEVGKEATRRRRSCGASDDDELLIPGNNDLEDSLREVVVLSNATMLAKPIYDQEDTGTMINRLPSSCGAVKSASNLCLDSDAMSLVIGQTSGATTTTSMISYHQSGITEATATQDNEEFHGNRQSDERSPVEVKCNSEFHLESNTLAPVEMVSVDRNHLDANMMSRSSVLYLNDYSIFNGAGRALYREDLNSCGADKTELEKIRERREKRKKRQEVHTVIAEQIEGHQGFKDVNELVAFVESNSSKAFDRMSAHVVPRQTPVMKHVPLTEFAPVSVEMPVSKSTSALKSVSKLKSTSVLKDKRRPKQVPATDVTVPSKSIKNGRVKKKILAITNESEQVREDGDTTRQVGKKEVQQSVEQTEEPSITVLQTSVVDIYSAGPSVKAHMPQFVDVCNVEKIMPGFVNDLCTANTSAGKDNISVFLSSGFSCDHTALLPPSTPPDSVVKMSLQGTEEYQASATNHNLSSPWLFTSTEPLPPDGILLDICEHPPEPPFKTVARKKSRNQRREQPAITNIPCSKVHLPVILKHSSDAAFMKTSKAGKVDQSFKLTAFDSSAISAERLKVFGEINANDCGCVNFPDLSASSNSCLQEVAENLLPEEHILRGGYSASAKQLCETESLRLSIVNTSYACIAAGRTSQSVEFSRIDHDHCSSLESSDMKAVHEDVVNGQIESHLSLSFTTESGNTCDDTLVQNLPDRVNLGIGLQPCIDIAAKGEKVQKDEVKKVNIPATVKEQDRMEDQGSSLCRENQSVVGFLSKKSVQECQYTKNKPAIKPKFSHTKAVIFCGKQDKDKKHDVTDLNFVFEPLETFHQLNQQQLTYSPNKTSKLPCVVDYQSKPISTDSATSPIDETCLETSCYPPSMLANAIVDSSPNPPLMVIGSSLHSSVHMSNHSRPIGLRSGSNHLPMTRTPVIGVINPFKKIEQETGISSTSIQIEQIPGIITETDPAVLKEATMAMMPDMKCDAEIEMHAETAVYNRFSNVLPLQKSSDETGTSEVRHQLGNITSAQVSWELLQLSKSGSSQPNSTKSTSSLPVRYPASQIYTAPSHQLQLTQLFIYQEWELFLENARKDPKLVMWLTYN